MFLFRNKFSKKTLQSGFILVLLLLIFGYIIVKQRFNHFLESPLDNKTLIVYQLPSGASVNTLAHDLAELKLISSPTWFKLSVRFLELDRKIKAGEYEITPGMSVSQLIDKLIKGDVVQHGVRIQSGWTVFNLFKALEETPFIEHHLNKMNVKEIIAALGPNAAPLALLAEGKGIELLEAQFYPDTYFVQKGTKDIDVLKRAFDKMQSELNALYAQRDQSLFLKSPQEVLILASIIEKESKEPCDQAAVASVLLNRLEKKMRLQADPTVIYGQEKIEGPIKPEHLSVDSPYNTYTRAGLPQGPIAIPSHNALKAALHPMESSLYYFVAKGDGTHHFSSTLEEHNHAINRYRTGNKSDAN